VHLRERERERERRKRRGEIRDGERWREKTD